MYESQDNIWHYYIPHNTLQEHKSLLTSEMFSQDFDYGYLWEFFQYILFWILQNIKNHLTDAQKCIKLSQMSDPSDVPVGYISLPYALSWTILKCQGEIFELFVFVGSLHHPDVPECVALIELYLQRMVVNGVFLSFLSNSGNSAISVNGNGFSYVKM